MDSLVTLRPIYRCTKCGSTDIQVEVWMLINREEVVDDAAHDHSCWCPVCDEHGFYERFEPDVHELKTWPVPFDGLIEGRKTWELRTMDRNFKVGDYLRLREWDPETQDYTGRHLWRRVTFILSGPPLPEGLCGMTVELA